MAILCFVLCSLLLKNSEANQQNSNSWSEANKKLSMRQVKPIESPRFLAWPKSSSMSDWFSNIWSSQNSNAKAKTKDKICAPGNSFAEPVKDNHSAYMFCNPSGKLEFALCPEFEGKQRKIFDAVTSSCIIPSKIKAAKPVLNSFRRALAKIGETCDKDADCGNGAICNSLKQCECSVGTVAVRDLCLSVRHPQQDCQDDLQCSALWPKSTCALSPPSSANGTAGTGGTTGVCQCPVDQEQVITKDGLICVKDGLCATNGETSKLRDAGQQLFSTCPAAVSANLPVSLCDISGDVYDCIATSTNSGYCCPSRGLVCIMAKDEGRGSAQVERYYFKSSDKRCEKFQFQGDGGNANNFETKTQCESFCLTGCPRGQPQYSTSGKSNRRKRVLHSCTVGDQKSCDANFECINSRLGSICCPTKEFVCSIYGGIPQSSDSQQGNNGQQGATDTKDGTGARGQNPSQRYYWDEKVKKCNTFEYKGQGGNFNNFETEAECDAFCGSSTVTTVAPAVANPTTQTPVQTSLAVSDSDDVITTIKPNPTTEDDDDNVTVTVKPTKKQTTIKPKLNPTTEDDDDDVTVTVKPTKKQTVPPNPDPTTVIPTASTCERGMEPLETPATCDAATAPCPKNYDCVKSKCCPNNYEICAQPRLYGLGGRSDVKKFFYDIFNGVCHEFLYSGEGGNANRFDTKDECETYCKNVRWEPKCPRGNPMMAEFGHVQHCAAIAGTVPHRALTYCKRDHECYNAQLGFICCPLRRCPDGRLPARDRINNAVLSCAPGKQDTCPAPTKCIVDPETNTNICCRDSDQKLCPPGSEMALVNKQVQRCTDVDDRKKRKRRELGDCLGSAMCYFPSYRKEGVCCTYFSGTEQCPAGQKLTDVGSPHSKLCDAKKKECPAGSTCFVGSGKTYGLCCMEIDKLTCANGTPWQGTLDYVPECRATPGTIPERALTSCPASFRCVAATGGKGYICCPSIILI